MLRFAGALMFTVAGTLAGVLKSLELKSNCETSTEIERLVNSISTMIRYQATDVYELSSMLKNSAEFERLTFISELPERYSAGEDFHEQWTGAVERQKNLHGDQRKLLLELGRIIGTSDIEGQISALELISRSADSLIDKYNEEYSKKGRLYRSIGVLAGVTVGILVI